MKRAMEVELAVDKINPKPEIGNPKEVRNPKLEPETPFGFRASGFLRTSDFGFRILAISYSLVIVSSRLSRTLATTVYAANSVGVEPLGRLAIGSLFPVARAGVSIHPSLICAPS